MALVLSVALAGLIGISLGLFGGGGSILAVPVLVYVTRLAPTTAIASSLAIVGSTSLVGTYIHQRRGTVNMRVGILFEGAGIVAAFLGARLTHLASERVLMFTFAGLMLVVGGWMVAARPTTRPEDGVASVRRIVPALLAGLGVGGVTGFLGVGGGFLVVPALVAFAGLDMRAAVGTSLLVIVINSAAGFLGHLDADLDFRLIGLLIIASLFGVLAGERIARRFSGVALRRGFALFVIVIGMGIAASIVLQTTRGVS